MSKNTQIQFKRTVETLDTFDTSNGVLGTETLDFGEPLIVDMPNGTKYLIVGPSANSTDIPHSIFFRGMSKADAENAVTYITENNNNIIVDATSHNPLKVKQVMSDAIGIEIGNVPERDDKKYHIICQDSDGNLVHFEEGELGIYVDNRGVMHGAAWNDYAEARTCDDCEEPHQLDGYVVCEKGDGTLTLSSERLQPCPYVVSDTFGTVIGIGNVNVAVAGKALVYTDDEVELGDCLAAGKSGKAVKMSRQEIINYPDRILGIVTEVSDDERVWVRVK